MITLLLLALLAFGGGGSPWPPAGWRLPGESDYAAEWSAFRKDIPTPFHVHADFNGDGIPDDAWILLRSAGPGWGLFVRLSRKGAPPEVIQLVEEQRESAAQYHGISLVLPGSYETVCGKGYRDCQPGEPEVLKLTRPAIEFFKFESASGIFFWDATRHKFRHIATSD